MDADIVDGNSPDTNREAAANSGWVTTKQAARSLGISPRTVRWHIEQGNLAAKPQGEGVQRTWLVSIDSLQVFREARNAAAHLPHTDRAIYKGSEIAADITGNPIRELADRLAEEAARAAEYRVRLELTEQAQSTLQEVLEAERRRREDAERERDELRSQVEALREERERPERVSEQEPRDDTLPADTDESRAASETREPWWRRWFGG